MTKSVFIIHLSKSAGKELLPYIEEIIPDTSRKIQKRIRTIDSMSGAGASNSIVGYVIELIQNKEVCYSIAAIVIAWIRSKNGKKVTLRKDNKIIECSGLNEQQLYKILEEENVRIHLDDES